MNQPHDWLETLGDVSMVGFCLIMGAIAGWLGMCHWGM